MPRTMLVGLFLFASLPTLAQAPPSADAYVATTQPTANFGDSKFLPVQTGTTSYVRLDLSAIPADTPVAKATLRLYVNAVAAPGSFDVYQLESAWTEKEINFNDAPVLGISATGSRSLSVTSTSLNQFILIDITPLAQAWINGSAPNYGVALALTSPSGSFSFDSKESTGTGHQPELEVVFGGVAVPPAGSAATSKAASTNPVVLSSSGNVITGSFTGNGAGLTGVTSGLNWPLVTKSTDYIVQISDFATPTTRGNYLILTGTASRTFTLPNPPPPNGYCVAIGNVADAGINSGKNVFLTVNPNGLLMDNSVSTATMPRRTAYLYCSDGSASYYRLGYQQNGVSQIGPWIKTLDTGIVNAMTTTFRNGMDFGLADGSVIFLLPKFANTSNIVTLNVNGLGAFKILRYGNKGLVPGDLSPNAYALLIYNAAGSKWELVNPQSTQTLSGTTASIGGSALTAGTCTTGTATVAGATVGHPVSVSTSDGSLPSGAIMLRAAVTTSNTVTVQLCAIAAVTPAAKTYNVLTQ